MKAFEKVSNKLQLKKFWQDESAQGMTEYILLIVVVVSLAWTFRKKITGAINSKMDGVETGINEFTVDK